MRAVEISKSSSGRPPGNGHWRLLDTGRLTAAENMALDRVLLESRAKGLCPNTLRFMQFISPSVLVGFSQCAEQEARLAYCEEHGIEVNRRITGGGAIFFDETQLGWEIICDKSFFGAGIADLGLFGKACSPVVEALKAMGLDAAFRPRNDIEVKGRKISGTGGTEEGGAFLFQGTLLVDFDADTMLRALRVPVEKLKRRELESAKERVTCLARELGEAPSPAALKRALANSFAMSFGITLRPGGLTDSEKAMLDENISYYQSNEWVDKIKMPKRPKAIVHSFHKAEGGLLKVAMDMDRGRVRSTLITGDFFTFPERAVLDLEAGLKDVSADIGTIRKIIEDFFGDGRSRVPGVEISDFEAAMRKCLDKAEITMTGIPLDLVNGINTVNGKFTDILKKRPRHLLLPYCSKSRECGWRYRPGCAECGECTVGEAYGLGRLHGMEVVTIQSFEHLMETLEALDREGATSYIGCCCEAFFVKHLGDFEGAGLPGILLDMDSETCYDLGKESDAYGGRFESLTCVNLGLLREVLDAGV